MGEEPELTEKDYSDTYRESQTHYFGETAAISHFDPKDLLDIKDMAKIFASSSARRYFSDAASSVKENVEFAKHRRESFQVYAVRGAADSIVSAEQVGRVQGYIATWTDKQVDGRVNELVDKRILSEKFRGKHGFQVSYGVRPWAMRGQMASGLRTVCQMTRSGLLGKNLKSGNNEETLNVVTKPDDIPVLAFVEIGNKKSEKVLKRAGFEKLEGTIKDDPDDKNESTIWILNWAKLDAKMQQKADKKLLENRHMSEIKGETMM